MLRPETPPELARFVSRALEKRPEDRWPAASEMARTLESVSLASGSGASTSATLAGDVPSPATPAPAPAPAPTAAGRSPVGVIGVTAAVALLLLVAVVKERETAGPVVTLRAAGPSLVASVAAGASPVDPPPVPATGSAVQPWSNPGGSAPGVAAAASPTGSEAPPFSTLSIVAKVSPEVVGKWRAAPTYNGIPVTITLELRADGSFECVATEPYPILHETGRFTAKNGRWTLTSYEGRVDGGDYEASPEILRLRTPTYDVPYFRMDP